VFLEKSFKDCLPLFKSHRHSLRDLRREVLSIGKCFIESPKESFEEFPKESLYKDCSKDLFKELYKNLPQGLSKELSELFDFLRSSSEGLSKEFVIGTLSRNPLKKFLRISARICLRSSLRICPKTYQRNTLRNSVTDPSRELCEDLFQKCFIESSKESYLRNFLGNPCIQIYPRSESTLFTLSNKLCHDSLENPSKELAKDFFKEFYNES
jgi:hypothetical protein